jgi:hypothetical protein
MKIDGSLERGTDSQRTAPNYTKDAAEVITLKMPQPPENLSWAKLALIDLEDFRQ